MGDLLKMQSFKSLQFRDKDVLQDSIKSSAQIWVDEVSHSFLIHNTLTLSHQALFACSESMLVVTNHLLIFCMVSRRIPSIISLSTSLFSPFKNGGSVSPLQTVGSLLDCHGFSNTMGRGPTAPSTSSLRPHTSVSPQVPWLVQLLLWMISHLIFYAGWFSIPPVPAFAFCTLGGVTGALHSENSAKKSPGVAQPSPYPR